MITGVRYLVAIRTASSAISKQSDGVAGASTTTGDSPFRPYSAISRSACSVLVGMPVDRQADGLGLEGHARARGAGHPERPAERRAQRGTDPGDLVLRLERPDPEPLVLGQLMQNVRGR